MVQFIFYINLMLCGQIVCWMLEEVGELYEQVLFDYGIMMKVYEYLVINLMGKVFVIKYGDVVVIECVVICVYLVDVFLNVGFVFDLVYWGDYYCWLFFGVGLFEQVVMNKLFGFVVFVDKLMMVGYGSFEVVMDGFEVVVVGKIYIVGDWFSVVDVYVGLQIGWGLMFGSIEKCLVFEIYWVGICEWLVYLKGKEIDNVFMLKQGQWGERSLFYVKV